MAESPCEAAGGQPRLDDDDSDSSLEFQTIAASDGDDDEYASEDSEEAPLVGIDAYSGQNESAMDDRFLRSVLSDQSSLEQNCLDFDYVDFLSDFGSNEPFLIDGDALVVSTLNNTWLDWKNGGQFLHHAYVVECFLQKLCDRGCQFDIFFMLGNANLLGHEPSYLLARTILMHHLQSCKSTRFSKVHLVSGSWLHSNLGGGDASSFMELLNDFRPSFIMTNSGSQQGEKEIFAVAQMHFAHHCLVEGKIVITFERLTFEGSRVFGFVYLPPRVPCALIRYYGKVSTKLMNLLPVAPVRRSVVDHAVIGGKNLRDALYLKALCLVVSEDSHARTRGFAMMSIACTVLIQRLSLNERAFVLPNPGHCALAELSALSDAVRVFEEKLFFALTESLQQAAASGIPIDPSVADIFDGRLFSFLLLQLAARWSMPVWLDEHCFHQFTSSCVDGESVVFKIKQSDVVLFTDTVQSGDNVTDTCWWSAAERLLSIDDETRARAQTLLASAQHLRGEKSSLQRAQLRKVDSGEMLSEVLGNVSERMKEFEVEFCDEDLPSMEQFSPHHYHRYVAACGASARSTLCFQFVKQREQTASP